ncbi:MAG: cell wall-binding repeat-containing protein, partial [Atopobiaceae bacterium]|nr:cell wall-binding repeat-containing protein [Atopobiaceae bacterium]
GTAAVTPAVEKALKDNGVTLLDRLAGGTGVQTSREIANCARANGLSAANMAYATSQNFPDALAGAAPCGRNASVLLLCDDTAKDNLSFSTQHKDGIVQGYVFGGDLAFSPALFDRLPV